MAIRHFFYDLPLKGARGLDVVPFCPEAGRPINSFSLFPLAREKLENTDWIYLYYIEIENLTDFDAVLRQKASGNLQKPRDTAYWVCSLLRSRHSRKKIGFPTLVNRIFAQIETLCYRHPGLDGSGSRLRRQNNHACDADFLVACDVHLPAARAPPPHHHTHDAGDALCVGFCGPPHSHTTVNLSSLAGVRWQRNGHIMCVSVVQGCKMMMWPLANHSIRPIPFHATPHP